MKAGKIDRVRRRLLAEAVADNLETMRGGPPRALRPVQRHGSLWLRRAPLVLVPLTLLGSSYVISNSPYATPPPAVRRAAAVPPAPVRASIAPLGPATIDSLQRVSAAAFPLSVRRVVLDAGHGGNDPGATTPQLREKEVTLDIGKRLERLLAASGFEVVTTRSEDQTVPLRDRARRANESTSDIFVSIHVNTITQHTDSHGVETYYLGPTADPSLTKLAADENRGSGYSLADMRKLLDRVYADVRRDESRLLASTVQEQLYGNLRRVEPGLENWGVKRAPFLVLVATDMPAILAEVGCLSSRREAEMLHRPEYRQQIAQALFQGIHAYAQKKGT